jgi:hypothetical protein
MRNLLGWAIGISLGLAALDADAVEVAPRITDREIVERLTALEAGQKKLEARIDTLERSVNQRIDGVERSLNARIDDLRADLMARFDLLTWLISLFVTIAMVTLGFVLRMQWQLQQRQTRLETSLDTQKDEIAFLKSLIEKLLPPRTAL